MQTSAMKACFQIAECRFSFCKGRKNIGIMQVHVGSFVRFPYFCVIILLLWVEKLQSKGEENVWKGFCILIRELIHPYESVSISLCNLRS